MFELPQIINFGKGATFSEEVTRKFPEKVKAIVAQMRENLNKDIEKYTSNKGLYVINTDYTTEERRCVINGDLEVLVRAEVEVRRENNATI